MAGDAGHEGEDQHGIEVADLSAAFDVGAEVATIEIGDAERVREEPGVEPCGFEGAGELFITLGIEDVVEGRGGVAPAPWRGSLWARS